MGTTSDIDLHGDAAPHGAVPSKGRYWTACPPTVAKSGNWSEMSSDSFSEGSYSNGDPILLTGVLLRTPPDPFLAPSLPVLAFAPFTAQPLLVSYYNPRFVQLLSPPFLPIRPPFRLPPVRRDCCLNFARNASESQVLHWCAHFPVVVNWYFAVDLL